MTVYLANAIPNGWLLKSPVISTLETAEVLNWLTEPDPYQDYDDNTTPHTLKTGVVSLVGHQSTAQKWGELMGSWVGATHLGKIIPVDIPVNREPLDPCVCDKVVAGLFVAPHRLPEGERWTEDLLLANTHWVLVEFDD